MPKWCDDVQPFGRDPRDAPRATLSLVSDNGVSPSRGADDPSRPEPSPQSPDELLTEFERRLDDLLAAMDHFLNG